jgi:hypothetical protein
MFHVKHGSSPTRGALASDLHLRLTSTPITGGSPRAPHESARSSTRTDSASASSGQSAPVRSSYVQHDRSSAESLPESAGQRCRTEASNARKHGSTEARTHGSSGGCFHVGLLRASALGSDPPPGLNVTTPPLREPRQNAPETSNSGSGHTQARYAVLTSFEGSLWSAPRSVLPARFRGR